MTQLFVQLAQTVTGNVITIVALEVAAAIIGYLIAWFYAKSVFTPKINGIKADRDDLNKQVAKLKDDVKNLNGTANNLNEKIARLEEKKAEIDKEIKDLSAVTVHQGKYVISKAKSGENYFNLVATNGQTILTGLMHSSMADCTNGIESVRENCIDDNRFERKTSSNNKHFFNLTSSSGQIIGKSEMYESMANMEKGISSVKRNGISTTVIEEKN